MRYKILIGIVTVFILLGSFIVFNQFFPKQKITIINKEVPQLEEKRLTQTLTGMFLNEEEIKVIPFSNSTKKIDYKDEDNLENYFSIETDKEEYRCLETCKIKIKLKNSNLLKGNGKTDLSLSLDSDKNFQYYEKEGKDQLDLDQEENEYSYFVSVPYGMEKTEFNISVEVNGQKFILDPAITSGCSYDVTNNIINCTGVLSGDSLNSKNASIWIHDALIDTIGISLLLNTTWGFINISNVSIFANGTFVSGAGSSGVSGGITIFGNSTKNITIANSFLNSYGSGGVSGSSNANGDGQAGGNGGHSNLNISSCSYINLNNIVFNSYGGGSGIGGNGGKSGVGGASGGNGGTGGNSNFVISCSDITLINSVINSYSGSGGNGGFCTGIVTADGCTGGNGGASGLVYYGLYSSNNLFLKNNSYYIYENLAGNGGDAQGSNGIRNGGSVNCISGNNYPNITFSSINTFNLSNNYLFFNSGNGGNGGSGGNSNGGHSDGGKIYFSFIGDKMFLSGLNLTALVGSDGTQGSHSCLGEVLGNINANQLSINNGTILKVNTNLANQGATTNITYLLNDYFLLDGKSNISISGIPTNIFTALNFSNNTRVNFGMFNFSAFQNRTYISCVAPSIFIGNDTTVNLTNSSTSLDWSKCGPYVAGNITLQNFQQFMNLYNGSLTVVNSFPLNSSQFNILTLSINSTIGSSSAYNCSLFLNSSNLYNWTNQDNTTTQLNYSYTFPGITSDYSYYFNCSNNNSLTVSSSPTSFFIDINPPSLNVTLNNSFQSGNLNLTFALFDDYNKNTFNYSDSCGYKYSNSSGIGSTLNLLFNIINCSVGSQQSNITFCDGKTTPLNCISPIYSWDNMALLNISANSSTTNQSIANFTIYKNGVLDGTANGYYYALGNLSLSTYNITIDAPNYEIKSALIPINQTNQNYTFFLHTTNSLQINIYDENTYTLINQTTDIKFSSNTSEFTNSTATGSFYIDGLTPEQYLVTFTSSGYSIRSYIVTITNRSFSNLNVYLANSSSTTIFTVTDIITQDPLNSVISTMYRIEGGSWQPVESKYTDITGKVQFSYLSNQNYKFYLAKSGYEDYIFYLNPILFSSYDVKMTPSASSLTPGNFDLLALTYTKNFTNNQNNTFNFLISSPSGILLNYGFNLSFPSGYSIKSGVNTLGEQLTDYAFINSNNVFDKVNLTYYYETGSSGVKTFTVLLPINFKGSLSNSSFLSSMGEAGTTYGLSIFERVLIATIILIGIVGIASIVGQAFGGFVLALFVLGYLVYISFLPIWIILPSLFVGAIILAWKGGSNG